MCPQQGYTNGHQLHSRYGYLLNNCKYILPKEFAFGVYLKYVKRKESHVKMFLPWGDASSKFTPSQVGSVGFGPGSSTLAIAGEAH